MQLPTYGSVLNVRPEILDPRGLLDMVDLGLVSDGRPRGLAGKAPGVDVLRDPAAFFAITYPSVEIVETLRTLARRATAPESGLAARKIEALESRRYFASQRIPVVVLVEGRIEDRADGTGLHLSHGDRTWSLAPMLGTRFSPARPGTAGWWWAPQVG